MKHSVEVRNFLRHHFRHFNAAAVVDAAEAYCKHIQDGGRMLVAMAGAMSTAELGVSLAEMIRAGKVHAISCTGANLEEDLFNLVAHDHYRRIPNWRDLTPAQEQELLDAHLNRVTDTCIPEGEAIRRLESVLLDEWQQADQKGERLFPHQFLYRLIRSGKLEQFYQIDPKDSWMVAAAEKNLPIFVPGWEDSTTGNIFTSYCMKGVIQNVHTVRSGVEYMMELANWYQRESAVTPWGFFQIGGGIAGDFPICVVPMLRQDMELEQVPLWSYFCQISDSTTSYGSYSGATPNEKITWEKLGAETPKFMVESDATIVVPLVFAYVLADAPVKRERPQMRGRRIRPAVRPARVTLN
ncbi:MAG: deoxyhypusine synthase family protein [Candidatus Eremiobacteraeota bacterium]|nr:deoxyhypusine synthase family protein [Candidatus Eremiobacteraeota bacterium]